ncbi:protocadherin Fat 4 [Cebidichthys violaceus]|uniref:protocadherin Fat 4 n=1 Tax=Cebidichthys violaceus TaxID=271503 RepID=UPI0035CC6C81
MSEGLVLRFDGNDYIEYVIKERFKRDYLLKDLLDDEKEGNARDQSGINIKFKTQDNGVLIFVVGQTGYTTLQIKHRKLVYITKDTLSGHLSEFIVDSPVADGFWHVLSLFSNGQNTFLLLDGESVLNITGRSMDITPVSVERIIFGAALTSDSNLQQLGFTGCVQYFNVSGYTLPVSGRSVMMDVWPSSTLVQSSCSSPGVCLPSPCSEEDTARRRCLSAHCQNRRSVCGPGVQNRSCVCLHNVSDHACDICISATESRNQCSEIQGSVPLWLIAVILPVISVLVIIGLCVALYRVRRKNAKCQSDSSPKKTEQGTDNVAFRCDDNRTLADVTCAEKEKQHDPMSADQQRLSVEFCGDASQSSVQPVPNSELDYYEIGSISSALHSDTASLTHHLYDTKCVKADPKRWGELRMLLAGFKKERSNGERPKSPTEPQGVSFLNKQLVTKIDAEHSRQTPPCYQKKFVQPEFMEPAQCLTFEEISKLNTPLEQTMSPRASLRPEPAKSATMIDASSDSETDSTSACSESECGLFSLISTRRCIHGQSSLSACSFTHTCGSAAGQHEAQSAPSSMFEQWESILKMQLPFSSYAPVFEDLACLPTEPCHSNDSQSDIEEII